MTVRKWTSMVSLGALVLTGTLLGTPSPASASPTNCTITNGSNWAQSLCTGGTGEHRIVMIQRHFLPEVGLIPCLGEWAPVGSVSYTRCANHTIVSIRVDLR